MPPVADCPPPDLLKSWAQHHRAAFDRLEPPAGLWAALEAQLRAETLPPAYPETDELQHWVGTHRTAFDRLQPQPALWAALETQLALLQPAPLAAPLVAHRGQGAPARARSRWQRAAAAVVLLGLGYSLRMTTEPTQTGAPAVVGATEVLAPRGAEPPETPASGYEFASASNWHNEPDPALNAAFLLGDDQEADHEPAPEELAPELATNQPARPIRPEPLAPEVTRLETRYKNLLARRRAELHRVGPARPLVEAWDREMGVLDSTYAELRHELGRNPNTDDVVQAMTRNLHLRIELLDQQARALETVRQARNRADRTRPRRPPSVNPDAAPFNGDEPAGWLAPPVRPAAPLLPESGTGRGSAGGASATVRRPVVAA